MHAAVTTYYSATNSYSPDDLLALTNRTQTNDTIGWPQEYIENWHLSADDDDSTTLRHPIPQKAPFRPNMTTINDTNASHDNARQTRWRLNQHGQLIDSAAESDSWDLADEIVRLKLGDVANDGDDALLRTPPKSKMGHNAVTQLADASPLETTSSVGSSPHSDHQINISHSRGSSIDTTASSRESVNGHNGQEPLNSSELKERPHSFSGGLSNADLRRLQQVGEGGESDYVDGQYQHQQWAANEQMSYPSLSNVGQRPPAPPHAHLYDYRTSAQAATGRDDTDYAQQRNFAPNQAQAVPFSQGRGNSAVASMPYRQHPRGFPQQTIVPSPTALGYPGAPQHSTHLSLGNSQQVYDMMLPPQLEGINPALARVQQQHTGFRGQHHHSTSDPSALRDAATLALLNNNMQFAPGMFPGAMPSGMPLYQAQYYGVRDAYARPDPSAALARLQQQYTGPYGMQLMEPALSSPSSSVGQNGPSANNRKLGLYKTELCRSWEEKGSCRYGTKCQFAHGDDEVRKVSRHPKYKTEICRTFWVSGSCPYGKRCCFIHTELPTSGGAASAGSEGTTPAPSAPDGRARSMSTNSDPNEGTSSRLARIRTQDGASPSSMATPVNDTPSTFQFTRPPLGSLKVDTSVDAPSMKQQNKSAYPTFASNGILLPAPDRMKTKSPAPVTAGPDLGRHNASRLEIVGYNQRHGKTNTPPSNHNPRSSMNGSEDLSGSFSPSPPVTGHAYTLSSGDNGPSNTPPRVNGHVRAGSAGNWGSFSRSSHLASAYPHAPSPVGEHSNSPWSTTELTMSSSRFGDKAWA